MKITAAIAAEDGTDTVTVIGKANEHQIALAQRKQKKNVAI